MNVLIFLSLFIFHNFVYENCVIVGMKRMLTLLLLEYLIQD